MVSYCHFYIFSYYAFSVSLFYLYVEINDTVLSHFDCIGLPSAPITHGSRISCLDGWGHNISFYNV